MSTEPDWRDVFCGREAELRQLIAAYEAVAAGGGPRLAVVCADRGMGKTRLAQELYRHLSAAHDPDDYWPDASLFKGNNLRVAPDFNDPPTQAHFASFTTAERPMPFLWWGFRLPDPLDRNAVRSDMAAHRRTLDPHLERARFAREHAARHAAVRHAARNAAKDAVLKIGEALLDSVPGVGLGKNLIEVGAGLFKTARAHRDAQREREAFDSTDLAALDARRVDDLYERTMQDLAAVLEPHDELGRVPAIVFCDDAQFARDGGDEGALRFLQQLWQRAEEEGWPLLLLATHWAVDWEQDRREAGASFAHAFAQAADDGARSTLVRLPQQADLGALIEHGLAGLPRQDVELLLRKVDGNPQVLIELVSLVQRSPGWRTRQGALSPLGRKAIDKHHCNLTRLITERLLSDATPPEVRLAVALSSVQGMQFLGALTEAAADALELGPADDGLAKAADPLRLVVDLEAGVASFVQRAYRDAAEAVLDSFCEPAEVKAAVLDAAIRFVDEPARRAALAPPLHASMLGAVATLGAESDDDGLRLRAGQALVELVGLAVDKAQRATHARDFEAGLGTKWPLPAFSDAQVDAVRRALADWYGAGRTVELCDRIVARRRDEAGGTPAGEQVARLELALLAAAKAHEARGDFNSAFVRRHEIVESRRRRAAADPGGAHTDALCDALRLAALTAESSSEHADDAAGLYREVCALRRQQLAAQPSPHARERLIEALMDRLSGPDRLAASEEIVALRRDAVGTPGMLGTPDDACELAGALDLFAEELIELGRADEAVASRAEALAVLRRSWQAHEHARAGRDLVGLLEVEADRRAEAGDLAGQRQALCEALEICTRLPADGFSTASRQILHEALARNAAASGDWALAREHCLQVEALVRKAREFDSLLVLRSDLAAQAPAGTAWLPVGELQAELEAHSAGRERNLATLRQRFADASSRSAQVATDLAQTLKARVEAHCEAERWDEAEQAAAECVQVVGWARTEGLHDGTSHDADGLDTLCWGLDRAGRWADALRIALEVIRLRREKFEEGGDEANVACALIQAVDLAEALGDLPLAARLLGEWLALERRVVESNREKHLASNLLEPLQRLAACAKRLDDWALHDAAEHERLAVGTELWRVDGVCDFLLEAACALAASAHRRGDAKAVAALAAQVESTLRDWRQQQGIGTDLARLVPAFAAAAAAWRDAGAAGLHAELAQAFAAFGAACRDLAKLQNAAVALRDAGELDLAEPLQRRALEVAESRHGEHSEQAASASSALGRLLALKGDSNQARSLYARALAIRERHLGADAEPTRLVRERLAELAAPA